MERGRRDDGPACCHAMQLVHAAAQAAPQRPQHPQAGTACQSRSDTAELGTGHKNGSSPRRLDIPIIFCNFACANRISPDTRQPRVPRRPTHRSAGRGDARPSPPATACTHQPSAHLLPCRFPTSRTICQSVTPRGYSSSFWASSSSHR